MSEIFLRIEWAFSHSSLTPTLFQEKKHENRRKITRHPPLLIDQVKSTHLWRREFLGYFKSISYKERERSWVRHWLYLLVGSGAHGFRVYKVYRGWSLRSRRQLWHNPASYWNSPREFPVSGPISIYFMLSLSTPATEPYKGNAMKLSRTTWLWLGSKKEMGNLAKDLLS